MEGGKAASGNPNMPKLVAVDFAAPQGGVADERVEEIATVVGQGR